MPQLNRLKQEIRAVLANRISNLGGSPPGNYIQACTLLPLFMKKGNLWVLFTKRADDVERHKGEISFPGGVVENQDKSMEHTAKRETSEEIGVLERDIEILGQLDDMTTLTTGFIIHSFVGILPYPCKFRINKTEVDSIIQIPLKFFLDPEQPEAVTINYGERLLNTPGFVYRDIVIWGATQRILESFVNLVRDKIDL